MLIKECKRCGRLIEYGSTYCKDCKPLAEKEKEKNCKASRAHSQKKYNSKRDPKYEKFYKSTYWRVTAMRYTQDKKYKCEKCGAMATQVHHRQPIQTPEGWERRFDLTNLELLCTKCHNARHHRFGKSEG